VYWRILSILLCFIKTLWGWHTLRFVTLLNLRSWQRIIDTMGMTHLKVRHRVAVIVWLSLCGCHCVAVTVWLSLCGCHCVAVIVWLSPCGCHFVAVTVWLSLCGYHCLIRIFIMKYKCISCSCLYRDTVYHTSCVLYLTIISPLQFCVCFANVVKLWLRCCKYCTVLTRILIKFWHC